MIAFWERVHGHLSAGSRVFVACVAEHTRGSPGTAGAKLLVSDSGELFGTIGGGAMEHRLVEQARALLHGDNHRPEKHTLVHRESAAGDASGLICEGSQTNVFCVLDGPRDLDSVRTIADRVRNDQPGSIEIDDAGLRLAEDGAGFAAPRITLTEEDEGWRYREDLFNRRRLAVIGGGHCAAALEEVMAPLGYRVRVFDTRAHVASHDRATAVGGVSIVGDYADAGPEIAYPESTAVVVMTADYRTDVRAPPRRRGPALPVHRVDGRQEEDRPDIRPASGRRDLSGDVRAHPRASGAGHRQRDAGGDRHQHRRAAPERAQPPVTQ